MTLIIDTLPYEIWERISGYLSVDELKAIATALSRHYSFGRFLLYDFIPRYHPFEIIEDPTIVGYCTIKEKQFTRLCCTYSSHVVQHALKKHGAILAGGFARGDGAASDIDLFFFSIESLDACLQSVLPLLSKSNCFIYKTNDFVEIFLTAGYKIQFIHNHYIQDETVSALLATFDASYIKCAIHYNDKDQLIFTCTESYLDATLTGYTAFTYVYTDSVVIRNVHRLTKAKKKGFRILNPIIPDSMKWYEAERGHMDVFNSLITKGLSDKPFLGKLQEAGLCFAEPSIIQNEMMKKSYNDREICIYNERLNIGATFTITEYVRNYYRFWEYIIKVDEQHMLLPKKKWIKLKAQRIMIKRSKTADIEIIRSCDDDFHSVIRSCLSWNISGYFHADDNSLHEPIFLRPKY